MHKMLILRAPRFRFGILRVDDRAQDAESSVKKKWGENRANANGQANERVRQEEEEEQEEEEKEEEGMGASVRTWLLTE